MKPQATTKQIDTNFILLTIIKNVAYIHKHPA